MNRPSRVQRTIRRRSEGAKLPVTQRNAWEVQADEAGQRFTNHRPGKPLRITDATTASYHLPSSPGTPIPFHLRSELEPFFNADLSAVRIHRDAVSTAAARQEGAHAFAAGSDIFFDQGAATFDTEEGKQLLAHEVTHVLQQTGRTDSEGRLQATNVEGPGEIQRKGEGSDWRHRLNLNFDYLTEQHRKGADNKKQFDEVVTAVKEVFGSQLDETSDGAAALESAIQKKDPKIWKYVVQSESYAGYIFDVLKFTDRFAGAATVLQQQIMLQSFAPVVALTRYYIEQLDKEAKFFEKIAVQHPALFPFWPDRFKDTFVAFLFGPTRTVPGLVDSHGHTFADSVAKYDEDQKNQDIGDNELAAESKSVLGTMDQVRTRKMTEMREEVKRMLDPEIAPVAFRYELAIKTLKWSQELTGSSDFLTRRVGATLQTIAQSALDCWVEVTSREPLTNFTFDAPVASANKGKEADAKRRVHVIPHDKLFTQDIPAAVLTAVKAFGKNKANGDLPTATEYSSQLTAAMAALKKFVLDHLESKLIELARKGKITDEFAFAIGGFLLWFQDFFKRAESYKVSEDDTFAKDNGGVPDIRFAHRYKLDWLIRLMISNTAANKLPSWKALYDETGAIIENKGEKHSRLAILGDWKADRGTPIKALAADFDAGFQGLFSVFTGTQLANIYLLIYSTDLTAELKSQMSAADKDFVDPAAALKKKAIVNEAIDAVDARSRPTRYIVNDFVYAGNKEKEQDIGEKQNFSPDQVFSELVYTHPKTSKLEADEIAKGRQILHPVSPYAMGTNQLFLWSIPDPNLVFNALRGIDAINVIIATNSSRSLDEVKKFTFDEWMVEFKDAAGKPGFNLSEPLNAALTQARTDLNAQLRLAVSHERLLIVAVVKLLLAGYTGHGDTTYGYPLDILHRIESFGHWALPHEDQQAQLTALFLGIAPELHAALEDIDRYDVITGYYGFLLLALAGSEGEKVKDLARVVPDAKERGVLIANRTHFDKLLEAFDEKRAKVQARFGFRSEDGKTLQAVEYEEEIEPRKPFKLNGYTFELVKVHHNFKYNPPYGHEGTDSYGPPKIDDKVIGKEYKPTGVLLFEILIDGRREKITDKDTDKLTFYSNIIEMEANIQGLKNLNDILTAFAEFTLDAVELVPGAGQAVAAARIITTIVEFLASGEFDQVKELVTDHPIERLEAIWEHIKEAVQPENIWLFILFGNPVFDWLKNKIMSPKQQAAEADKEGSAKGLGKILAGVRGLERGLGRAWDWLEGHIQHPLRQFQAFVLSHPILALIIDLVSDNIERIMGLKDWFQSNDKEAGFSETARDVSDGFRLEMENLLDTFQQIQLPREVIPTDLIIAAIIDLILGRLGTKGKVTRLVLDTLGLTGRVSTLIKEKLVDGTVADPNKYWRDPIVKGIEERLNPVRDAIVDDVYDFLTQPPLSLQMTRPVKQYRKLERANEDAFPEAAPSLSSDSKDTVGRMSLAPPPRPGAGMPLPASMRGSAERRFGHDFSHVRLHTGNEAASVTGAFAADGLTTGSHVYMSPSLSMNSQQGRRVMDHELTHVLQQTGHRPLGGAHSSAASIGREGGGLRYDPAQENAAERVSSEVGSRTGGGPIDPGPMRSGGYQPAILSIRVLRRFMRELTDVEKAKQAQRSFDKEALASHQDIDDDQIKIGTDMWDAVRKMIPTGDLPTSSPNLKAVANEFKNYFDGIASAISGPIIQAIAFAVSEPEKDKSKPDEPPARKLHPKRFVGGLEDYLLAKAGILVNIQLNASNAVEKVVIKNLLLDMVGSGSRLWTLAMTNAGIAESEFDTLRPILRSKLREINTKTTFVEIRANGLPTLVRVWDGSNYAFGKKFVEEACEQATTEATKGRPTALPEVIKYLDHKDPTRGVYGIRIGKYGDNNHHGVSDRESHHTTQFLLIEYFQNLSDNQPFPNELRPQFNTLGLKSNSTKSSSFNPLAAKPVEFAKLGTGTRGEAMPAILIARPTHRQANLHINGAKPEDFEGGDAGAVTQGEKVHETFLNSLRYAGAGKIADSYPADAAKMQEYVNAVGVPEAGLKVYKAIQNTYGWMYRHMMPALERGLHNNERDYYEMIVAASHTDNKGTQNERIAAAYDLQPDQMEPVYTAAEKNNNAVMQAAGWFEP